MKEGFRQRMSWLHTWCGLTFGWLLCAIFLAGTLSVFREPITRWMQGAPALPASAATDVAFSEAALSATLRHLADQAGAASVWSVNLPEVSGDAIQASWRSKGGSGQFTANPVDGSVLPQGWARQTEGGRYFMLFHYTLYAGIPGFWLVGWIAMCGLVAMVTGIIVHKRIFKDFFTFRPGKGQRSWLDAHNAGAVLALPFVLMITYTGLTYFYSSYMPFPLRTAYGADDGAYQRYQAELNAGESGAAEVSPITSHVSLPDLAPLLRQAAGLMGTEVCRIFITQPGKDGMVIRLFGGKPDGLASQAIHNDTGSVVFEQKAVRIAQVVKSGAPSHFGSAHVHPVLEQLHVGGFGGWGVRWLYFLSGAIGTAMIATGLHLFAVKRRQKSLHEFGRATPQVYRMVEVLNVVFILGACLASIGYFYANRLIPAEIAGRDKLEIAAYFGVWLTSLLHAGLRPTAAAWREQCLMLAVLCLGLPLLNGVTLGQHLLVYVWWHDWQRAGVELTVLGIGCLSLLAWRRMSHKPVPVAAKAVRT